MRKKWLLSLLAAVVAFACMLTACNDTGNNSDSNGAANSGTQSEQNSDSNVEDFACAHTGGEATCTAKAVCDVCGKPYGDLVTHEYTELKFNTSSHWYECVCGAKDAENQQKHSGGTATCDKKAECEVCGKEYGLLGHDYSVLKTDDLTHWYECECGDKNAFSVQSHTGGEATCTEQAVCGVCNQAYGELAEHMGGEATCTTQAVCGVCGNSYGELAEHTGGEATCTAQAACDVCGEAYGKLAAHNYEKLNSDNLTHWYECECGAKNESSVMEHDYTEFEQGEGVYWYNCICGAKGEELQNKSVEECVDFVVEVETGREIRVLQLTDVQTISSDQKRYPTRVSASSAADIFNGYQKYIGQVIDRYDPDFIIMTGDNTYGEFDDNGQQLLSLVAFMDSFQIPWAPVFGNHDNESNMGVDWQCQQFVSSKYCLFKQRTLTGNGNYSVGLTQGGELKRVFYMLDSNGCGSMSKISLANGHGKTGAGFGDDQIEWYSASMEEINRYFPNAKLSMAFHIQIYAFEKAMRQYGYNASTVQSNPINLDTLDAAKANGDFGHIGRAAKGPWDSDYKVWNTIKKYGVDSVFVGHEHCNSASIMYEGVRLTYGQKSSTFDRYNRLQSDGSIKDNQTTSAGIAIMGGTYINLSESDGSISDMGLYLYDHELGWEMPEEDNGKITIDNIPADATVTEFDFDGTDFDTMVTTDTIKSGAAKKITDTASVPTGFTDSVYGRTTNDLACVGISFSDDINADGLLAVFVRMYVSKYAITSDKTPLIRIYNATENKSLSELGYEALGGEYGKWVTIDILPMLKSSAGIIENGKLAPFTLLYRFYGAEEGTVYFDSITMVTDGDLYLTQDIKTTEFDFNGTSFNTTVTTEGINPAAAKIVEDTSSVPAGFTGSVYSYTTNNFGCVGVKFPQDVNADSLRSVFVKMYVSKYTITAGKAPLLRIYNATDNTILCGLEYESLGGVYDKWVTIDILPMLKSSAGIIENGKLAPFTLLYRFYGDTAGTVYFDSVTVVSNGDMYSFGSNEEVEGDGEQAGDRSYEVVRNENCYQYKVSEFDGVAGTLEGGSQAFMEIDEKSYSIKFSLTAEAFNGGLCVFAYTNEKSPQSGICVRITKSLVEIGKASASKTLKVNTTYEVKVGFVSLFNDNTVYTFVEIDGKLVVWELVEVYGKTPGNIVVLSTNYNDSFTIA